MFPVANASFCWPKYILQFRVTIVFMFAVRLSPCGYTGTRQVGSDCVNGGILNTLSYVKFAIFIVADSFLSIILVSPIRGDIFFSSVLFKSDNPNVFYCLGIVRTFVLAVPFCVMYIYLCATHRQSFWTESFFTTSLINLHFMNFAYP